MDGHHEDDFADAGHPDTWPAWCDDEVWMLGPGPSPGPDDDAEDD